jgi:GNAT superfamily N-acetyltransferase
LEWSEGGEIAALEVLDVDGYPTCERNIIERDGVPVGRLWVDEWRDQIRLVDIALVAEYRGQGIGSTLLRQVMDRGAAAGKPVGVYPFRRIDRRALPRNLVQSIPCESPGSCGPRPISSTSHVTPLDPMKWRK